MDMMEAVKIRTMRVEDYDAIIEIDKKVLGKARPDFWRAKLEEISARSPAPPLVAELEGKVVGFVLGEASGWEYGIPDTFGTIDTIGVDPEFQKKGIGRTLVEEMISNLRKLGVSTIYTFVNWRQGDLLRFFDSLGFSKGDMINLELKV